MKRANQTSRIRDSSYQISNKKLILTKINVKCEIAPNTQTKRITQDANVQPLCKK